MRKLNEREQNYKRRSMFIIPDEETAGAITSQCVIRWVIFALLPRCLSHLRAKIAQNADRKTSSRRNSRLILCSKDSFEKVYSRKYAFYGEKAKGFLRANGEPYLKRFNRPWRRKLEEKTRFIFLITVNYSFSFSPHYAYSFIFFQRTKKYITENDEKFY